LSTFKLNLPDFAIPSYVDFLDALPRNGVGRVLKNKFAQGCQNRTDTGFRGDGSDRCEKRAPLDGLTVTPEQQDLQACAEKLGRSFAEKTREWDESDGHPYCEIVEHVGADGSLGAAIPAGYGGKGGSAVEYLIVVEALFRYAQSWLSLVTGLLHPRCRTIDYPARQRYHPGTVPADIVADRRTCNIARTEPKAGSALSHLNTTAVRDGDDYILNGSKGFLTSSKANDLNATFVGFDECGLRQRDRCQYGGKLDHAKSRGAANLCRGQRDSARDHQRIARPR
jgi:hypothetical protein